MTWANDHGLCSWEVLDDAKAEIERLRKALELSCRDESAESWDLLVLHYLKEARRG